MAKLIWEARDEYAGHFLLGRSYLDGRVAIYTLFHVLVPGRTKGHLALPWGQYWFFI